jgi:serine/threonine-protein kinase
VNLAFAILAAALLWLIYIALEPTLRRRWPHRIVSWNRLLTGNFRDPLVGKDLLIGALAGIAILLNTCYISLAGQPLFKGGLLKDT